MLTSRHEPLTLNLVIARDFLDAGPRHGLAMARHALRDRIEPHLAALDLPALVVRGTHDRIASQPWAESMAALARAELVVIDGPHALNFSRPQALAGVLAPFFHAAEREQMRSP